MKASEEQIREAIERIPEDKTGEEFLLALSDELNTGSRDGRVDAYTAACAQREIITMLAPPTHARIRL